ncbi:MAG: slipin family protein [Phycisphaeraceae bacterium]
MFNKIRIRKHEVGLWFRHGDFKYVLGPGAYLVPRRLFGDKVEVVSKLNTKFDHPLLDVLVREEQLASRLLVVDLKDNERALVWKDGRLGWILGPGRHTFWNEPYKLEVETFDVSVVKFEHAKIEAILGHPGGAKFLDGVRVEAHERVLLFCEGKLVEPLGPGMYVFWKNAGKITWKSVDLREQVADVAGQEIMSADKVTLRVNLVVTYRVMDVEAAITRVSDYAQALYREAQLVLRESVGTRSLDKLLSDKDTVGNEVRNALSSRAAEFGVSVRGIGLRDIILPGDMKVILNEVILAQKQAEANLIRRREETAAARSQANTAKLLADNPTLARMKELEALQEILKGAKTTFVLGQGDMVEQVRGLLGKDAQNAGASSQ